jgi:hypothetical protein
MAEIHFRSIEASQNKTISRLAAEKFAQPADGTQKIRPRGVADPIELAIAVRRRKARRWKFQAIFSTMLRHSPEHKVRRHRC